VLLPGLEQTCSYLCAADEGSLHTLHSVNHGAGQSAQHLGRPLSRGGATRIYGYEEGLSEVRPHLSDDGPQAVLATLQEQAIVRPVARLRPLAVLKGSY
jgi:tRNA-splicing ligase RtcB